MASIAVRSTIHTNIGLCILAPLLTFLTCNVQSSVSFLMNDTSERPLRVASFNIRHFGNAVMSKDDVPDNIVSILQRYDLVFIMETRDSLETSLVKLRHLLGPSEWEYVASDPVGRSPYYKEQYVYFYRPALVNFLNGSFYDDSAHDVFEREPYMAQFQYWSHTSGSEAKVTFVGIHAKPTDVIAELDALPKVISSALQLFPDSGAVITMGDFNADCRYASSSELATVVVFNTTDVYTSFVPDTADTTVSHNTDCAYDRVVLRKGQGSPEVKVKNVTIFDFESSLGLSFEEAYAVSDHYPVEFNLV